MKKTSMIIAAIAIMTLGGCTKTSNTVQYNEESWKTMVPSTCTSFFDGCNTCNRMEN
jgi:outer membrane lipoprotein SlyB